MSTVLKQIIGDWELQEKPNNKIHKKFPAIRHKTGPRIRYKENCFKHKCNKELKNKLKKYKLRRDGKEDPDVINVSHIFQTSLRVKSPSINNNEELDIYDTERPKNYLFKMVRRKKDVDNVKSIKTLFKELPEKNIPIEIPVVTTETTNNEQQSPSSQEKKHTNAFKLMMESRNKSIGSNSPGKEKPLDETEVQLKIEEKNTKAKRLLLLQKMAEQKGSLKKKEKEELLEEAIKRKMDKRAERLTNMIANNSGKKVKQKKEHTKLVKNVTDTKMPTIDNAKALTEKQPINEQNNGALHFIDIFDEPSSESKVNGFQEKCVAKVDLEFLGKLSPSIRKKENMLCYFKKIEKDFDSSPPVNTDNNEMSPIIKVKFGARTKKKIKKKKLSLSVKNSLNLEDTNKCSTEDTLDVESSNTATSTQKEHIVSKIPIDHKKVHVEASLPTESKAESRKRKREQRLKEKHNQIIKNNDCLDQSLETKENRNERPKRNIKKPIQYTDDFVLSSSDGEYNIFTPKKKKHNDKKTDTPKSIKEPTSSGGSIQNKLNNKDIKKPVKNNDVNKKANLKLAPIFASKPQLDPAALEAKQRFLQSGVPEKLKKIAKQLKQVDADMTWFPTVVHVQQFEDSDNAISNIPITDFRCESPDLSTMKCSETKFKTILSPTKPAKYVHIAQPDNNVRKVLQNIKQSYPKFPVYRTYQQLKEKSKGEFGECSNFPEFDNSIDIMNNTVDVNKVQVDKLNWTDKYKPMVTNQIIGNFETTKELKKWLETWSLNDDKRKTNGSDSDSSDFYHSDTDSRDSVKTIDNLLVLTGPTGCGKTSCVYAVAADLAMKVIEVNASSKRTGKIMLQDLQEATQSHKVNRGKGTSTETSQKSQEIVEVDFTLKTKKRGRPKKVKDVVLTKQKSESTNSQESCRTGMSLILIDDADIVFDQDDGFCSAISQLVQYSKRPVILVTSSLICPHLQRLLQTAKIMTMKPLLPRMLGTWLDIMCLADSGTCWPGLGSVLLDLYKGDIRKTINCLQFYATTNTQGPKQMEENSQTIEALCDEASSMSWAGSENHEERNSACDGLNLGDTLWKYFMERQSQLLHIMFPSDLWQVWWNIPGFLTSQKGTKDNENHSETRNLEEVANIIDNISAADYFGRLRPDVKENICSQPWYSTESDSSSEIENFSCYNRSYDVNDDISKTLVVRSICNTQKCLQYDDELHVKPTNMVVQRDRDRIVKRHDSISAHLNPGATLDRRALALDYWSSCRAICRFEKEKTDTNSKRNNRFCHYLRSLKIMCKNDVFDKLGESLHVKRDD